MHKKINDEVKQAIGVIREHVIKDCDNKRKYYIPLWKLAGYYWNNIQDLHWDYEINDWLAYDPNTGDEFEAIRDSNKIANVYRADGESMIAAATIGNFAVRYYPDDASDARDIEKARSYSDITEYLQIKNNIRDLRREAFAIRYRQGLVASYVYYEKDEDKYGVIKYKEIKDNKSIVVKMQCNNPECEITDERPLESGEELLSDAMNMAGADEGSMAQECPNCGEMSLSKVDEYEKNSPEVVGDIEEPRGCSKIELFSPLEVRVPFYARKPEQIDYVVLQTEMHFSEVMSILSEEGMDEENRIPEGNETDIEAFDREQLDYFGSLSSNNLVTLTRVWALPNKYNIIHENSQVDVRKKLLKDYPNGFKATFVNDRLFNCKKENLKKHWSFIKSPVDTHVYCLPIGSASIPLQDMLNDLIFITLDTIKHSTGDTWVDARIVNRKVLNELAQAPGSYLPVFPEDNRSIGEHFFSSKSATLSREVDNFYQRLEQLRQHATGVLPSVFGGRFQGGSQTFGEYKTSRDQALQRISMPADNIDDFLAETFHKAVELYAANMKVDESYSVEEGGSYVNKQLRKPHSKGRISRVEPMKSEQFPLTFEQQRQQVVELLGLNKEPIDAMIFAPENLAVADKVIAVPGLKVPGINDRNKQLKEIRELLEGRSPDNVMPSVVTDPDIDNHDVHIATATAWCLSPEGLYQQKVNNEGFKNILLHIKMHKQNIQQTMMKEQEAQSAGAQPQPPSPNGQASDLPPMPQY